MAEGTGYGILPLLKNCSLDGGYGHDSAPGAIVYPGIEGPDLGLQEPSWGAVMELTSRSPEGPSRSPALLSNAHSATLYSVMLLNEGQEAALEGSNRGP